MRMLTLHILWGTRRLVASSTTDAWISCAAISGVTAVEPQHVCVVVIPQTQSQHHALFECNIQCTKSTLLQEICAILEEINSRLTIITRDGIEIFTPDREHWNLHHCLTLSECTSDFHNVPIIRV